MLLKVKERLKDASTMRCRCRFPSIVESWMMWSLPLRSSSLCLGFFSSFVSHWARIKELRQQEKERRPLAMADCGPPEVLIALFWVQSETRQTRGLEYRPWLIWLICMLKHRNFRGYARSGGNQFIGIIGVHRCFFVGKPCVGQAKQGA